MALHWARNMLSHLPVWQSCGIDVPGTRFLSLNGDEEESVEAGKPQMRSVSSYEVVRRLRPQLRERKTKQKQETRWSESFRRKDEIATDSRIPHRATAALAVPVSSLDQALPL